jgi:NADPH:quinone reductase-like Zn-dependent oxidoreductase
MKAARYHETGPVDVIRYEDLPDPRPARDEVVVAVKAAALNRLDVFLRSGTATMPGFKLPHIGGFDISGVVAEVGENVDPAKVGQPVLVKARVTGSQSRGRLDIIGTSRPGGFAERVLVPVHCLAPKPDGYSFEEAAAFGCVYLTAYYGLLEHAKVQPGEFVLVHAAGSGAGSAAIQVAKAAGATVITTAGSDDKCDKAIKLLGAHHAINYKQRDFGEAVREITGGRGVDVAFDPVWGESAAKTLDALALRGRWIVLGMVGGLVSPIDVGKVMFKEITIRGIIEFYADDLQIEGALRMARRGLVRPLISRTWPLADLAGAQSQMERGDFFGKIVILP